MIPHILWQTAKTETDYIRNRQLIKGWTVKNPTFDIQFMDDNDCEAFIYQNFDQKTYNVYKSLPLGIMRADFWRIAIIYINGGVYSDTDVYCHQSILPFIENRDLIILKEQNTINHISNFFFAASPKHPFFKQVLDTMIDRFEYAYDSKSDMLVQNYGMHSLQIVLEENKYELVPPETWSQYVLHECHGSWRESEHTYRNTRFMKPITFFTTFHQKGYDLYGKKWIQSFIENVAPKGANIKALIYGDDLTEDIIQHPQVQLLNFKKEIPEHASWLDKFMVQNKYSKFVSENTIRFSHKGFAIQKALDTIKTGYAIWLDGDCVMHDASYENFPQCILEDENVMACQLEEVGNNSHHIESGVLVFNMDNPNINNFKKCFKRNYELHEVFKMGEPYDGYIVYKSIDHSRIKWNNLNDKYGIGGIQSDPTLTFLHPEIKSRFTHNIGLTGKSQYEMWEDIKYTDKVYSRLASVGVLSPRQRKINSLLRKKAKVKIK